MVTAAHGVFSGAGAGGPCDLLGDAPVYSGAVQKELVTPTGAPDRPRRMPRRSVRFPPMKVERVGYGPAGDRDDPVTRPNVFARDDRRRDRSPEGLRHNRLWRRASALRENRVTVDRVRDRRHETRSCSAFVMERLLRPRGGRAGSVLTFPVQMKKNRSWDAC